MTTRVTVLGNVCSGCGLCAQIYPDVFRMAGRVAEVRLSTVPDHSVDAVHATAEICPTHAICVATESVEGSHR